MPSRIAALIAERAERAAPDAALVEGRTGQTVTWGDLAGRVDEWTGRSDLAGRAVLLKEERPLAFITLLEGHAIEAELLKAAIEGKVAYDLKPLTVSVVAELPMTPTGKISKVELAARWSAMATAP